MPKIRTSHLSDLDSSASAAGMLFVVSTPIGDVDDITLRALRVLKKADVIVAEEGKVAARLMAQHLINKPIEELNEHNERTQTPHIVQMLRDGKNVALVSDCGTPLLADPGGALVREAIAAGLAVQAIPGASSVMTALVTSGLPMHEFLFAGFLSREPAERRIQLRRLAMESRTVVVLETPYRLLPLMQAAAEVLPERRAYLGCNLTMPSETHHYGTIQELYAKFSTHRFKGEFVLCFEGTGNPELIGTATPALVSTQRDSERYSKHDEAIKQPTAARQRHALRSHSLDEPVYRQKQRTQRSSDSKKFGEKRKSSKAAVGERSVREKPKNGKKFSSSKFSSSQSDFSQSGSKSGFKSGFSSHNHKRRTPSSHPSSPVPRKRSDKP